MRTSERETKTMPMTIVASRLRSVEELRSAVRLQQILIGERARDVWQVSHLHHVQQSGGYVLGVRDTTRHPSAALHGLLIDLLAEVDGYPARRTVIWGVDPEMRGQGVGTRLREIERLELQEEGVDLVYWDVDPLSSVELHVALTKLGAILTGYMQDALGSARDERAPGLATDRVRAEWWIDSPRATGVMERRFVFPHHRIGLHEMAVLTKTSVLPTGVRGLMDCELSPTSAHVLVEIPHDLADMQARDVEAAMQWRLRSREVIDALFTQGYLGVGLIHEGGRSFLLFSQATRRTALSAEGTK
jgi:predicted GNAT superfamily acetyltransferase